MELSIVEEAGMKSAIQGMAFSFQTECKLKDLKDLTMKDIDRAFALCKLDGGHNKFLESIMVWIDIRASLKMWKQLDTYRVGVTKQSKSTMHTIMRKYLTYKDFDAPVSTQVLTELNNAIEENEFEKVCDNLPSSFLQTRRVCLNYKAIRNIIKQRRTHKLPEWQQLCEFFFTNLQYPGLLGLPRTTGTN